jgi:hypothetical protein
VTKFLKFAKTFFYFQLIVNYFGSLYAQKVELEKKIIITLREKKKVILRPANFKKSFLFLFQESCLLRGSEFNQKIERTKM